jgi:hypothetical protein
MSPSVERTITTLLGLCIGMAGNYLGMTAPAKELSVANRDANWSARDSLKQCHKDRDKLMDAILLHTGE